MTREALLALAERLEDAADDVRGDFNGTSLYQREYDVMMEAVTALRALATPPAVCEACHGRCVVPVWDSERADDWHTETCRQCCDSDPNDAMYRLHGCFGTR